MNTIQASVGSKICSSTATASYKTYNMDSIQSFDKLLIKREILENTNISIHSDAEIKLEEINIKDECETSNEGRTVKKNILRRSVSSPITESYNCSKKLYKCFVCGYKVAWKNNVVRHMRTHTGEKPYSCSICDYKARMKDHLVNHMRTHTGERPYRCSICDYKAIVKGCLVNHEVAYRGKAMELFCL